MRNLLLKMTVALLGVIGLMALSPASALADCTGDTTATAIQCGTNGASGVPGGSENPADTLNNTTANVINVLSLVAGAAAVIMLIVGGFRYITSSGNAESAKGAKNTIVYAIIGLVIVAIAQLIVHFVLDNTTGAISNSGSSGSSGSGVSQGAANSPH